MESYAEDISGATAEASGTTALESEGGEPAEKKLCLKRSYVSECASDGGECSVTTTSIVGLEKRLSTVLCCTVCLDLPISTIYQCPNGHLMCAGCLNHLLADGRLKNEMPTCPNCRIEITESLCMRNLAVEKAVSELPTKCKFCQCDIPRCVLEKHEKHVCSERLVFCKYEKIGCHWQGPLQTQIDHEERCAQARKTGLEIMENLEETSKEKETKLNLYQSIFALLSFGRTSIHDLQLRPRRTDDFVPELFYESNRFCCFGKDWMIRSQVVGNEKSLRRGFTFQLMLTTKSNMFVKFIFVRSPYGDLDTNPVVFQHEFTQESQESLEQDLPVSQAVDINKLLAARVVPLRLIMFFKGKHSLKCAE